MDYGLHTNSPHLVIVRVLCRPLSGHGHTVFAAVLGAALLGVFPRVAAAQSAPQPDAGAVRAALVTRVNAGSYRGIAGSWAEGDALQLAAAGTTVVNGAAIDAGTRFEIGEAGEVFTTALLANLVAAGALSLDDLAQRFLPPGARLPTRAGRAITLGDLAFHRAGLPTARLPAGGESADRVARALRGTTLKWDIGSRFAFSPLGVELLGLALAHHLRMPLATAVKIRLLSPLGITDIAPSFEPRRAARDAVGHTQDGAAVASGTSGPGMWRASAIAMARFASAASDTVRGPLASTFALMMRTRSLGPDPTLPVALGWRVLRLDDRDIYWHDAQDAPGFSTYLAMDPKKHRASAVLSNTAREVDAIAGALLLGRVPAVSAAAPRERSITPARRARR
jgi:serine-type D-Ala-D-Ala carboxypeptidase/endopeptidase